MANTQQQQQQNTSNIIPFRAGLRAFRQTLDSTTLSAFGTTGQRIKIAPVGFLHKLWLVLTGTITSGAGTPNGAWKTYPFLPYSLLSKIHLEATPGSVIMDVSGDGLAQFNSFTRRNDINSAIIAAQYGNAATLPQNYQTNTGSTVAATPYTFTAAWELPISTDDSLMWGLIPIANEAVMVNLTLTLANLAAISSETGVSMTPNFTATVVQESLVPLTNLTLPNGQPATVAPPDLRFVHKIIETPQSITAVGQNRYKPLIGPTYLRQYVINENNNAQMTPANIQKVNYNFAAQSVLIDEPYAQHVGRVQAYTGQYLPSGAVYLDWTNGQGVEGVVDTRDMINSMDQTDINLQLTYNNMTLTAAQMRVIEEYLTGM